MKTETWWAVTRAVISGILLSIAAVIGFRYLLPPLAPFILALVIAAFIRPAAMWCRRRLGIGAKPVSVVLILAILTLLCLLFWSAGTRLFEEMGEFIVALSEDSASPDSPMYKIARMGETIREKLPLSPEGSAFDLEGLMNDIIENSTSTLSSALASIAGSFIKKLPAFLFAFAVCFIALFYLTLDYEGAAAAIKDFFPGDTGKKLSSGYKRLSRALTEYLRAYLLIMLITFAELYLGFIILRVEYSLLFASVIALVDFLPLLGVGTILIPWSAGAFLLGNHSLGIGLLVLWVIICVVRQFAEPKIVGDFIGTHPLVALLGVYVGLRLFGFAGMIAAPVILYLAKALGKGNDKIGE